MKRFIACAVLLAMCLALFAGCTPGGDNGTTAPAVSDLENARAFLYNMYKDSVGQLRRDLEVVSVVSIGGVKYDVTWSVEVTAGSAEDVTLTAGETIDTIDITEKPVEQVDFTLTATVSDTEGNTQTVSFKYFVAAAPVETEGGPILVETLKTGTGYKFAMVQANLNKTLYFAGAMKGEYFATTEFAMEAVDVFMEEVEGGVRFYFMDGETKTYLEIYKNENGKIRPRLTTEATAVFVYNETLKRYTVNVEGTEYYLGTYGTFNTISASDIKYISGDKAADVGVSQFPANFYTLDYKTTVAETVNTGVGYKFTLEQVNLGTDLYFTGAMKGEYFATTTNALEAVDVFVEEVEGGVRFYFMDGETKTYLEIYKNENGKIRPRLTTEATAVFVYNETLKRHTVSIEGTEYYLGTYGTFNTISASDIKYISGDKAANVGVTQFPANFVTLNFKNTVVEEIKTEVGYKFSLEQVNLGQNLYFTGAMSGEYFATTTNALAAVDVFMEEVEGGVRFYFMDGETKTYLEIYKNENGKIRPRLTAEASAVFVYNETLKRYTVNIEGTEYYLGTYGTYNTISASDVKYISGDKAADVGVSQFPANLVLVDVAI